MSLEARAGLGKAGLTDIAVLVQNLFNVRIMQSSELHQIGIAAGMVVAKFLRAHATVVSMVQHPKLDTASRFFTSGHRSLVTVHTPLRKAASVRICMA